MNENTSPSHSDSTNSISNSNSIQLTENSTESSATIVYESETPSVTYESANVTNTSPAVTYNPTSNGIVIERPVIATNAYGKEEIQTQHYTHSSPRRDWHRPLTQRYMKILKCLSIVCAIIFFPTGIPAAFYAWKTNLEFDIGIIRGDIEKAQKCAKHCERLMIFTVLCTLMTIVLIVAIVERLHLGPHPYASHLYNPRPIAQ